MEVIDMRRVVLIITIIFIFFSKSLTQIVDCPYPIIFIHGIDSDNTTWDNTVGQLQNIYGAPEVLSFNLNTVSGSTNTNYINDVTWVSSPSTINIKCIYTINFNNSPDLLTESASNESAIVKQGYALKLAIDRIIDVTNKDKVVLVGHSMGGLAARDYLQRWADPNNHHVAKLLTLGTPHLGANIAQNSIGLFVNPVSEASRDLAATVKIETSPNNYSVVPGYYLFGGDENITQLTDLPYATEPFLNQDVNCNNTSLENIIGINQGTSFNPAMPLPTDIKYTYYTSNLNHLACYPSTSGYGCLGDGAVGDMKMWLYQGGNGSTYDYIQGASIPEPSDGIFYRASDRIAAEESNAHGILPNNQTSDYKNIYRGIDEGDFPFYAYDVKLDQQYVGQTAKRADFVALQSNIPIPGHPNNNDPYVDGDWYKLDVATTTTPYKISITKPLSKYCQIEFYSNSTPGVYENSLPAANVLTANTPKYGGLQTILNVGVLLPGTYYFRITTDVDPSDTPLQYYEFKVHSQTENLVISNPHKPYLKNGILDVGMMKIKPSNTPPVYNPDTETWTMQLNVYNGYFIESYIDQINYPNCEPLARFATLPPNDPDLFGSTVSLLEHFGSTQMYDGTIVVTTDFKTNSGHNVSFPGSSYEQIVKAVIMPLIAPILNKTATKYFKDSKVRRYFYNKVYDRLIANVDLSGFNSLTIVENKVKLADKIVEIVSEQVFSTLNGVIAATIQEIYSNPPTDLKDYDSFESDKINDVVEFLGNTATAVLGGESIKVAQILATVGGGIADLFSTNNLNFCFPFDYEDNLPYALSTPSSTSVNGGQTTFSWSYFDIDGDDLIYDVYIKRPDEPNFNRVSIGQVTTNYIYTLPSGVNGLFEWKVVVRYPYPISTKVESTIQTFEMNCPTNPALDINSELFRIYTHPTDVDLYDLEFNFGGSFDNNASYFAEVTYLKEEQIYTQIQPVVPNQSSNQNLILNLPKAQKVNILVRGECAFEETTFKPYPSFQHIAHHYNCSSELVITEFGNFPSYEVFVNDQAPISITSINNVIPLAIDISGSSAYRVKVKPIGMLDTQYLAYTFTCLNEFFSCPDELLSDFSQICEDGIIEVTINDLSDYRVEMKFNNGRTLSVENNNIDELLYSSFGSPRGSYEIFNKLFPDCNLFNLFDNQCNISELFLDEEGLSIRDLIKHAIDCGWSLINPGGRMMNNNKDLPSAVIPFIDNIYEFSKYKESGIGRFLEIYRDFYLNDNFIEFKSATHSFVEDEVLIDSPDSTQLLNEMNLFDFEPSEVSLWIHNWNKSVNAWNNGIYEPSDSLRNIFFKNNLMYHDSVIQAVVTYALTKGFTSPEEMYSTATASIQAYSLEDDPAENAVCASVGISLSQKLTMTREAFEGTLKIFNGATTGAMDSIALHLEIKNESGVLSNHLFEIDNTSLTALTGISGTGQLAANTEGIAKILFIPEKDAAPIVPRFYSFGGSISYIDPFSNLKVTMPLVPVTLQVNPSPDLFLHYFMQRDIFGDDAFTANVEPSIPARLAVMIENDGYGTAQNVRIQSAQPQVIDNEKGLALQMNLIGSKLQGGVTNWGLNNIDFGSIPPLSTRVGEWLFTSNLLGHFTGYSTNVRHVSSRGNPDLSLISGAQLHELIHSIKIYGAHDDDILDFLTNEVQDANDHPDAIFASRGNTVYNVKEAVSGQFLNAIQFPTFTTTLQVTPQDSGWFYLKLNDPGQGEYNIVSVTRNSDGQVIPLENAWLTYVTIPDTKIQKYEDKFHMVDVVPNNTTRTYTVVWSPKDPNPPKVDTILNVPQTIVSVPHTLLRVKFNKPIEDSTFTVADLNLTRQGGANLINNTVSITKLDSVTYEVTMGGLTDLSGYYVFTAQATGVTDKTGVPGTEGKSVSWIQNLSGPVVVSFEGIVHNATYQQIDTVLITFNLPIDTSFISPASFRLMQNNVYQGDTLGVSLADNTFRKFRIVGLAALTDSDNLYKIVVNLGAVKTTTGIAGQDSQFVQFTIDQTGPIITSLNLITESALDNQHKTGALVSLDQVITGLVPDAFTLSKNGSIIEDSLITIQQISPTSYKLFWGAESFGEGEYEFLVSADILFDLYGSSGQGNDSLLWVVNRTTNLAIESIYIVPDLGYSSTDKVTSNRNITLHYTFTENAYQVKVKYIANGIESTLISKPTAYDGLQSDIITFPIVGNIALKIEARDTFGNYIDTIFPVFIDELDLTGSWLAQQNEVLFSHPDSILFDFKELVFDAGQVPSTSFQLYRNNVSISNHNLNFVRLNDTLYRLEGTNPISIIPGNYRVDLQLSAFSKYLTGRSGSGIVSFYWEIFDPNLAPVANAGPDQIIKDLGEVYLNGSGSYDPDNNNIQYKWISLNSVSLSNDTLVSPTFLVNESHVGKMLSFLLIVADSSKSSSDLVRIFVELDDILVKTKVFLQGPYVVSDELMKDSLRSKALIPFSTPYINTVKYKYGNDGKEINSDVLSIVGSNAIVDWVYLELFSITADSAVGGGSYLLQRNGNIVDTLVTKIPIFENLQDGEYALRIYHRNHIPIMTSDNVLINQNEIKQIDLTQDVSKILGGINAVKLISGKYTMFSGDANINGQIQQTDINQTLPKIGQAGYKQEDIDMNGEIQNIDIQLYILPNLGRGKQF